MSTFDKAVSDLNARFYKATRGIKDNTKGSQLHKWEVDFAYLVDEITRGPEYIAPKYVDQASLLIETIVKARKTEVTK